jgi:DNA repair exonuclease SbcCD ATPase subunit
MIDIAGAVGSVKSAIEIAKLLKDSTNSFDKAEVKLQLAELISSLADAKMQIAEIREVLIESDKEKKELEKKLNQKENLFFDRPYYLIQQKDGKTDGPFCQVCYDNNQKLIRLQVSSSLGAWNCPICNQSFFDKNHDSEEAHKRAKDEIEQLCRIMAQ